MTFLWIGVGMMGAMCCMPFWRYSNEKAQVERLPSTGDADVHGPSRLDPGADRAVRPRVHSLHVRAVDLSNSNYRVYPIRHRPIVRIHLTFAYLVSAYCPIAASAMAATSCLETFGIGE
ncbi:hypothetical protein FIBSPDRAFT_322113 [Athelia psychrophila]|uniref:MFS general substrate transporter n=1 Tax=Athelia psychrophila TaxID=1759441 RepID=A0A166QJM2_9AGAM|nr:hypothetical protein FIBSPDRAFT_322113 [Fibularhizoctonia sp. CBS 109695]